MFFARDERAEVGQHSQGSRRLLGLSSPPDTCRWLGNSLRGLVLLSCNRHSDLTEKLVQAPVHGFGDTL